MGGGSLEFLTDVFRDPKWTRQKLGANRLGNFLNDRRNEANDGPDELAAAMRDAFPLLRRWNNRSEGMVKC